MISVVIPLYNKEKQIAKTLQSVLRQTFQDFEIVVVNDGSTDNGAAEVLRVKDSRIRLIHQKNAGVSAARNLGIQEARFDLIAFLDADDYWEPEYLAIQMSLAKKYLGCDVFAVNYMFRDEHGQVTKTKINKLPFTNIDGVLSNYFEVAACSNPPLWTSAVMARKKSLDSIGGFPIGIVTGEDLLTWAKLACRYKIAYHKRAKAFYELPSGGTLRVDPKDMSFKNDIVRNEMIALLEEFKPKGWRAYLSFWDKMRAVINIRKGERTECLKYAIHSIWYNPFNLKSIILLSLTLAPKSFIFKMLK